MKWHLIGRRTSVLTIADPKRELLCVSVAGLLVDRETLPDTSASAEMGARCHNPDIAIAQDKQGLCYHGFKLWVTSKFKVQGMQPIQRFFLLK